MLSQYLLQFLPYGEIRDGPLQSLLPDDDEGDVSLICASLISFFFFWLSHQVLKRKTGRKLQLRRGCPTWDTVWNVKSKALSVTLKLRICEEDTDDSVHVEPQPNISACFMLESWKVTFMCNCAATYEISLQVIHVETQSAACTNAWL